MCAVLGIAVLATSTQARADIFFQNPADYGGPNGYDAFSSQLSLSTNNNQTLYSEFSLSSGTPVGAIQWQGAYVNEFASSAPSPTAIAFNFYVYQGDSTTPNLGNLALCQFHRHRSGHPWFGPGDLQFQRPELRPAHGIPRRQLHPGLESVRTALPA